MPIELLSGLPGNGKTLRLLQRVRKLQLASGRPVFYFDIKLRGSELQDWIPLGDPATFGRRKEGIDPDKTQVLKWYEVVPNGAIMVVDECWFVFEKRGTGSKVPKHVEELATHRHRGIDIFLTSQHAANQIDHFVRGLVQNHEHVIRLSGTENARIHRWDQGLGDPQDYHSRQASVTELWRFPKNVYEWYHSAEVHTIKRQIPWKPLLTIVGGIAAIITLGYLGYSALWGDRTSEPEVAATDPAGNAVGSVVRSASAAPVSPDSFTPAILGVPFSAPFYSPAVKVTAAPQVAGCGVVQIGSSKRCFCTSQQGTVVKLDHGTCMDYFKTGSFRHDRDEDYYPKITPYVPPLGSPTLDNPGDSSTGAPVQTNEPADRSSATAESS